MIALSAALTCVAGALMVLKSRLLVRVAGWQLNMGQKYLRQIRASPSSGPEEIGRILRSLGGDKWYFGVYPYHYWRECIVPNIDHDRPRRIAAKGLVLRALSIPWLLTAGAAVLLLDTSVNYGLRSDFVKYAGYGVAVAIMLVMALSAVVYGTGTASLKEGRPFHARFPANLQASGENYLKHNAASFVAELLFCWLAVASAINYVRSTFGGIPSLNRSTAHTAFDALADSLTGLASCALRTIGLWGGSFSMGSTGWPAATIMALCAVLGVELVVVAAFFVSMVFRDNRIKG